MMETRNEKGKEPVCRIPICVWSMAGVSGCAALLSATWRRLRWRTGRCSTDHIGRGVMTMAEEGSVNGRFCESWVAGS